MIETQEVINLVDHNDDDSIIVLTTPDTPIRSANVTTRPFSKAPRSSKCILESHFEINGSKKFFFPKHVPKIAKSFREKLPAVNVSTQF